MVPEETKNKNSAAKLRANNRYAKDKYEEIKFRVRRGEKDKLMQYAREHDYSLNAFIYDAVCHYRQYLDEAISDQNAEERIADSAIADAPLSLSLNNENSYSVVNLFAGMGSMSLAFAQAGFDVIRAYEQDHTSTSASSKAFSEAFALFMHSSNSFSGTESATMPAPDWTQTWPFFL